MPKRPKQYLKKSLFLLFGLALVVAGSLGYDVSVIRAAPCTASGNDVTISTDCEFAAGTYHYTGTLTIEAGVTVTMQGNTSTGEGVTLVSDNFEINGTLTADSQGYAGGSNSSDDGDGPGGGVSSTGFAQGASHGGRGSNNNPNGEYGSVFAPIDLGSGGGNDGESGGPGDGGGAFKLFLYDNGTVTLGDGATLTANGGNASTADHGGGSGGSIWIDAPNGTLTLASTHTATVRANGGRTAVNDGGGAGGGGRIAVYAGTCTNCDNITYQAFGGAQGEQSGAFIEGGAGSIFLKLDGATNGDAIYDNNDQVGSEETTLVASSTQIVDNLTVRKGADLQIPDTFRAELAAGGLLTGGGTVQPRLVVFGGGVFDSSSSTFLIDSIDILHRGDIEGVTNLVVQDAEYQVNPDTARFPEQADNRLDGLTLLSGGIFESENDDPFYLDALEARSGSTLRHLANGTSEIYKLNISATSTIDVQSGATVNLDGLGYTGSFATGPGAGPGGGASSGFSGGGGHGGHGGHDNGGGATYGSPTDPDTIGSAGGNDGEAGTSGSGGGATKLSVASGGTITLNANITADGTNSSNADHGGGAGGSIWIDADGATIAGTATLTVNGGRGISNQGGGGGGGGRIAVYYGTDNSTWTKQVIGGLSGTQSGASNKEGGAGTIYIKSDAASNGELIVDNGGRTSANETEQVLNSEEYDDITITDGSKYAIFSGQTLTLASGGTLTGGGVQPSLTIADGGTFDTGNATFTFDSIDVVNSGDIGSVTDLTITSSTFTHNATGDFTAGGGVTSLTLSSGTVIDNGGANINISSLTIPSGSAYTLNEENYYPWDAGFGALSVTGTFTSQRLATIFIDSLTVPSGGNVTHTANTTTKQYVLNMSATSTIDVQSGGSLNVDAKGHSTANGPGAGTSGTFQGSGGGYGGNGGIGGNEPRGSAYGSVTSPDDIGSGGGSDGNDSAAGGAGGGYIRLAASSGTITVNGTVSADGQQAQGSSTTEAGGGSGGGIKLDADTVAGTGTVTANGGSAQGSGNGSGGGGGRIAVRYSNGDPTAWALNAGGGFNGGASGNQEDGGGGTIYLKSSAQTNGDLIVTNNERLDPARTPQLNASETYDAITIKSGSIYEIGSGETLALASGGSFTGGGTQQAELEILLGGTFDTGNATFTFDDIDVEQRGALDTVTDLTFTNGTYIVFSDTVTYPANGHGRLVDLTVGSGGTFDQRNTSVFYVEDLIVQSGGTVTHGDNSSGKAHQISISATNTVDVQSGGSVDINAKGMDASLGGGASDAFGEAGTFTSEADGGWTTINFNNSYTTPVVVGTTNSHNGQAALVFEARNVTSTSAEMRVCESEGSSSTGCDTHAAETVGYMVIDAADLDEIDGIEAGTFSVDGEVDTTTHSVSYSEGFGSTPRVFLNVNTVNGTAPTEPLLTTTSTTGFTAGLCQQNSLDGCDSTHVSETVGWIAIEPGFTFSSLNDSGTVSVSDSNFTSVSFSTSFSSAPVVLASTQTNNGGQHPKNDEARNVTTSGAEVRYCETESGDSCDTHAAETVAWLAVEAGDLAATIGAGGNSFSGGGGGHGGRGGAGGGSAETEGLANGSATEPVNLGSGGGNDTNQGGSGGSGGGAVKIVASGTLTVNGTVSANGQNTPQNDDAGGGAGGSVWLDADTLAGSGTVTVNGGNAVNSQGGGGGGGGRIALYFTTDSSSLTLQAIGGDEGNQSGFVGEDGGAGTIYKKDKDLTNGDLIVDNADRNTSETTPQQLSSVTYANITVASGAHYVIGNTRSLTITDSITGGGTQIPTLEAKSGTTFDPPATTSFTTLTIINDADSGTLTDLTIGTSGHWRQLSTNNIFSGSSLTIEDGGTFTQEHKDTISVDTVTIESGGTLTHCDNATTHDCEVDFSVTTFDVQTGGVVTADALGFDSDNGPGAGTAGDAGGGGGYGGAGGDSSTGVSGGSTYGSETDPIDLGSGGGDDTDQGPSNEGGSGAGAIILTVSTTLTVNGDILADGQDGISNGGGGGSGGTVNINVSGTWEGNGCISADGGDGSNSGGGGGGGRIRIVFGTKTYTGCTPEANAGTSPSGDAGTTGTTSEGQDAPTVDSVTHSPATPEVGDDVHLACQASKPDGGIKKIEIFLDGTDPGDLQKTCNFSPAETPANCDVSVGSLSAGSHTTTCRATDTSDATAEDTDTFDVISRTTGNKVTLSDLKVNAVATGVVTMTFSATSSGTLTVDWPSDFTVDAAATDAASDDCFSSFGFTSSTLTATKTDCTGTVEFGGFTVTNPSTAGPYTITWENDTGSATVIIVDDGDFNISASVDATITFNAGSQAAATACDGTFSGDGGTVALGQLTTSSVTTSDSGGIAHICIRASTNASGGATVTVASANGALASASVPGDTIPSSTETLTANDEGYGLCVGSGGTDTGTDTTTPASAAVTRESPFDGTCTTSDHNVGGLTTSPQALWSASGPTQNAFGRIYVKASISGTTAPHDDYTDTLTFILTGTY